MAARSKTLEHRTGPCKVALSLCLSRGGVGGKVIVCCSAVIVAVSIVVIWRTAPSGVVPRAPSCAVIPNTAITPAPMVELDCLDPRTTTTDLVSPTSVGEVAEMQHMFDELDGLEGLLEESQRADGSRGLERFVCVSDAHGAVMSANFDTLRLLPSRNIASCFSSSVVRDSLEQLQNTPHSMASMESMASATIISSLVCFLTLPTRILPVLLRLQQVSHEDTLLLIWTMKKAHVRVIPATASATPIAPVFHIDNRPEPYTFAKVCFLGAMNDRLQVVNEHSCVLQLLRGINSANEPQTDCVPLSDIIDDIGDVFTAVRANSHAALSSTGVYSVSALDVSINGNQTRPRPFRRILETAVRLKHRPTTTTLPATLTLYAPFRSEDDTLLFPIRIRFEQCPARPPSALSTPSKSCRPPTSPRYRILRAISESDSASVYEAVDPSEEGGTPVVIKKLHLRSTAEPLEVRFYRFLRTATPSCPHIEHPLAIEEDATGFSIVMEASANRCDLFDFIENAPPLTNATIQFIFRQLVEAVAFLHQHSIVHRDIKVKWREWRMLTDMFTFVD